HHSHFCLKLKEPTGLGSDNDVSHEMSRAYQPIASSLSSSDLMSFSHSAFSSSSTSLTRSGRFFGSNSRQRWISSHSFVGVPGISSSTGLSRSLNSLALMPGLFGAATVGGGSLPVTMRYMVAPRL